MLKEVPRRLFTLSQFTIILTALKVQQSERQYVECPSDKLEFKLLTTGVRRKNISMGQKVIHIEGEEDEFEEAPDQTGR